MATQLYATLTALGGDAHELGKPAQFLGDRGKREFELGSGGESPRSILHSPSWALPLIPVTDGWYGA